MISIRRLYKIYYVYMLFYKAYIHIRYDFEFKNCLHYHVNWLSGLCGKINFGGKSNTEWNVCRNGEGIDGSGGV